MKKKLLSSLTMLCLVLNLFAGNGPTNGLIAYWSFTGNANDQIGSNHGTVNGATLTTDRNGNSNQAYYFDGIDDNISLLFSNDTLHINEESTINFWFKAELDQNPWAKLLCVPYSLTTWSNPYHHMAISYGTQYGFGFANFDGINDICELQTEMTNINNTNWQLYSIVNNNGELSFYVDGILKAELSCTKPLLPIGKTISIGSRSTSSDNNGEYYKGAIDDIAIYDRALSQAEILDYLEPCAIITNDTTTYYVQEEEFQKLEPFIQLKSIESVSSTTGCDSTVYNYIQFAYKEPIYVDTTWVNDTIWVNDTVIVNIYDSISVTDTLVIDVTIAGIAEPNNINTIKVYPNPAKDIVNIYTGLKYNQLNDYSIKILNSSGSVVFESEITEQLFSIEVNDFGSTGLYLIQIIDNSDQISEVRKLLLE
jgi:hypothetical protein